MVLFDNLMALTVEVGRYRIPVMLITTSFSAESPSLAIRAISTQHLAAHFCKDDENAMSLREVDVGPLFVHYREPYTRRGYCSRSDIARSVSVDCFPSIAVLTLGYPVIYVVHRHLSTRYNCFPIR
jgi:hypothetical protein